MAISFGIKIPAGLFSLRRPKELSDLTLAVAAINAWNRLSIAARIVPGGYQPAKMPELELKKGA